MFTLFLYVSLFHCLHARSLTMSIPFIIGNGRLSPVQSSLSLTGPPLFSLTSLYLCTFSLSPFPSYNLSPFLNILLNSTLQVASNSLGVSVSFVCGRNITMIIVRERLFKSYFRIYTCSAHGSITMIGTIIPVVGVHSNMDDSVLIAAKLY